jgi:hypothetical protein
MTSVPARDSRRLVECGRLVASIYSQHTGLSIDERARACRASIRDILYDSEYLHAALDETCSFLIRLDSGAVLNSSGKNLSILALKEHLYRSYNVSVSESSLYFASGFLGVSEETCFDLSADDSSAIPNIQKTSGTRRSILSAVNQNPTAPPNARVAHVGGGNSTLSIMSLGLLGISLGILGFISLKALESRSPTLTERINNSEQDRVSASNNIKSSSAVIGARTAQPLSNNTPSESDQLYMGSAVGGQKVTLYLGSITPYPNSPRIAFRYSLGNELISSEADCGRREWMTLPEAKWHSPKSNATLNMLNRVCSNFTSVPPSVSKSGVAIVYDPPSNIRVSPNGAILCSVTSKGTIPIGARISEWYQTDFCGSPGYIHNGQIKF